MTWQANDLFVMIVDRYERDEWQQEANLEVLLDIYDVHGRGWYLAGYFMEDHGVDEDDYEPFNPTSWHGSAPSCSCWLPNPFMYPGVIAVKVRNARDLLEVAFEGWDSGCDCFAYAGDGDEPLEHMVVRGVECDMRAA